jgi:hypothetical protein
MDRYWVYHTTEEAKIVDRAEYERLIDAGEWKPKPIHTYSSKVEEKIESSNIDSIDETIDDNSPQIGGMIKRKKFKK